MEQQDSRDHGFGHALSGGPAHIVSIKKNAKTIPHRGGIYSKSAQIRLRPQSVRQPGPGLQLTIKKGRNTQIVRDVCGLLSSCLMRHRIPEPAALSLGV
jgi:hypothetical protein